MTEEEILKSQKFFEDDTNYLKPAYVKTVDNIREHLSLLAFALRYEQFEIFQYLVENDFGLLPGLEDLSKYNLDNPKKENLQEFYKDLYVAGHAEVLKELHRHLGYYEGYEGQSSQELVSALEVQDEARALQLISQGHYVYGDVLSALNLYDSVVKFISSKSLVHPNYNPNAKCNMVANAPLDFACQQGREDIAKLLLDKGADINAKDNNGYGLLHHAADIRSLQEVEFLIKLGADPNIRNLKGKSPLHYSIERLDLVTAQFLLKSGADINAQDSEGKTPLHIASGGSFERVKFLVEAGADINAQDSEGKTPLHIAIQNWPNLGNRSLQYRVVQGLVRSGADLNAKDNDGKTILDYAL